MTQLMMIQYEEIKLAVTDSGLYTVNQQKFTVKKLSRVIKSAKI